MTDLETLGLSDGASPQEIRRAYKGLVRAHHPDRATASGGAADSTPLARINAAYDRLTSQNAPAAGAARTTATAATTRPWQAEDFDAPGQDSSHAKAGGGRRAAGGTDRASTAAGDTHGPATATPHDRPGRRDKSTPESAYRRPTGGPRYSRQETPHERRAPGTGPGTGAGSAAPADSADPRAAGAATRLRPGASQRDAMEAALDKARKREAFRRFTEKQGGIYPDPAGGVGANEMALPKFHMAEEVSLEKDGSLRIHLGSESRSGTNIVALPELTRNASGAIEQGDRVRLVEMRMQTDGKSTARFGPGSAHIDSIVPGGRAMAVEFAFGSDRVAGHAMGRGPRANRRDDHIAYR